MWVVKGVDEEDLLTGLGVDAHHRVFGFGVLLLQCQALFDRHGCAKAGLDAVPRAQAGNLCLHVLRQVLVGERHIGPHRVAPDGRAFNAAQHAPHGRRFTPGCVGVPRVLVAVHRLVRLLVDLHQARVFRVTAGYRVIFQAAESLRKSDVLGPGNVLVTQEQHLVSQQCGPDLAEQPVIVDGIGQVQAHQFGADGGGQLFYAHHAASVRTMTEAGHAMPRPAGRWEMLVEVTLCLLPVWFGVNQRVWRQVKITVRTRARLFITRHAHCV